MNYQIRTSVTLIMTEWITCKLDTHLKIFNPAGCLWGFIQLSLTSAKDPYLKDLKPKETSEQVWSQKQAVCSCFYVLYKWDKKILQSVQFNWLKSNPWRGCLWGSNTMLRNLHGTAIKEENITYFLINKIQPMPQGNYAKHKIYLNAFFWNSIVHTWAPVWILHVPGSRQIGMTSQFVKFTGNEQCTWCIQPAQFC